MSEKLRIEIENATGPGVQSVKQSLGLVTGEAQKLGAEMRDTGKESSRALDEIRDDANAARKALHAAADAADDLGDTNAKVEVLGTAVTGLNQALEIGKKAAEALTSAVLTLADEGNPAAQSLVKSFGDLRKELVEIGDDPTVMNMLESLSDIIKNDVVPNAGKIGGALRLSQNVFADIITANAQFTGFFPKDTMKVLLEDQAGLAAIAAEQKKINTEARETALIYGRIADIESALVEESELGKIAQLKSERGLLDLLDLEIEAREELADAGELSGKKLEASDKKVEIIKRRLMTLTQEQADAEIKAQEDIGAARKKNADDYAKILADAKAIADEDNATKANELEAQAKAAADELKAVIGQAKSILNPQNNLVDDLRGQFGGKEVQGQLVKQAKEDARQKFISENRKLVDLEGRASGDTDAERKANQRRVDAAIAKAERDAVIRTTKQIRTGSITGEQELSARDALLMNRADKATQAGLLRPEQRQALRGQLDDSRDAFGRQQNEVRDQVRLEALRMDAPSQRMWNKIQDRRANMAGGTTQGTTDRAMGDLLGNVATGNQAYTGFAQSITQGFGQLSNQFQQQSILINSLQGQVAAIMDANNNSAARTRATRGSR